MNGAYTLEFEKRDSYLYAYLEGKDSLEASLEYWRDIASKCHGLGLRKVLVHENLTGELDEAEIYLIVTKFADAGFLGIKVAFYDENADDEQLNAFGQLVATNRGAMVKIFPTLEDAEKWIKNA